MKPDKITVALAGNPNVGKTTLFNAITGTRQHTGNYPGVTVEKKTGNITFEGCEIEVVDLPGTYSLTAYSIDEKVARDYIIDEKPDVVVHVVDATNLERNLYLTTQLMELGAKMVISLNMADLAEEEGHNIEVEKIEEFLEIPAVKTIASRSKGIKGLLRAVVKEAGAGEHHEHEIGYGKEVEDSIIELIPILEKEPSLINHYPIRWFAVKLLEEDAEVLSKVEETKIYSEVRAFLDCKDTEMFEAEIADKRYEAITSIIPQVCTRCVRELSTSDMVDKVVTNKYVGIPIFLALMWGAFELTFTFATPFMNIIDIFFGMLGEAVTANIQNELVASFLGDALIGGLGAVIIFVPNIFILFFLLSVLEDSGYLARAAFVMDRLMYSLGLNGRSFIPLLMGFGCNVPAIMATRTIEDKNDRLITILVAPFITCGARLPVYLLFTAIFFGKEAGTILFLIYITGIIVAILSAKLFRMTLFTGSPSAFIMELPPYRMPTIFTATLHMWDKGKLYLKKAGTIIFAGVILVWLLASFPAGVEYGSAESYAGMIGQAIQPILAPAGFNWQLTVALIFGFIAKEIVVSSIGTLYGVGESEDAIMGGLSADPTVGPLVALGFMLFVLLYMPCVAAVAVIKQETNSWKWTGFQLLYGTALAWLAATLIFQVGSALGFA